MKNRLTLAVLFVMVTLIMPSSAIYAQGTSETNDPESVFRSMYEAINAGDLEASLAIIAESTVGIAMPPPPDSDGIFIGQDAYHGLNSYLIGNNAVFEFTELQATGATITFRALLTEDLFRAAGVFPIEFTGTAIIRDGLLVSETWLMDKRDDARLTAAIARQANIAIVERLYQDLFAQGNLDVADEIIAPDFINHDFPNDPPGPEPIRQTSVVLRTAMPDLEIMVSKWIAEEDLVVSYVTFRGTHEGEFLGVQPTGNLIEWTQIDIQRIENGQIAEVWHPIPFTLFEQIGFQLTPPGLSSAPSLVPGVSDNEIILGAHTPLTGPLANFSQINRATKAYFDYINETAGGVHGRKITYLLEDDQYAPPLSVEVTQKLVEENGIFAMVGGLGTLTHMAVVDYLQDQGVPDLFVIGGSTEWTRDPAARPTVFGSVTHYAGEGAMLGRYLVDTYPGQKLGILYQEAVFEAGIAALTRVVDDRLEIVAEESYAMGPPDLSVQVTALHAAGADVIVAFAGGPFFANVVEQARTNLSWDVPIVAAGPGISGAMMAGTLADGVVAPFWQRSLMETDHLGVAQHLTLIADYSDLENATPETLYGQYLGELTVEVLERAGPDLTREGVVAATESIQDWLCSICLYPINMSETDHSPVDVAILSRFDGATWRPFGNAYSWEGVLPDALGADNLQVVPSPYHE